MVGEKITNKIFNIRTTTLGTLFKSLITILLGFIIFYIDDKDFFNYHVTIGIIFAISILKCFYFILVSYHKIMEVSLKNTAYYEFMLFMAMNIFIIIISFGTDFFCLVQVDSHSLRGFPSDISLPEKMFECFYFSVLNFSFFGYGDIIPATIPAKIVMMFETILSFLTVILVLSDFISLKESIAQNKEKSIKK